MLRIILLGLTFVIFVNPTYAQERTEFKNIESFVTSFKGASLRMYVEGDLMGQGRSDWVGAVVTTDDNDEEIIQIYILEKLASGHYAVVEKSEPRPAFGGTGNFAYEDISINKKSLFVELSYHWHECAGITTSQFKLHKNNWQKIGVESFETNQVDGSGIDISSSANLITGITIVTRAENGKSKVDTFKTKPILSLFKDYDGDGGFSLC